MIPADEIRAFRLRARLRFNVAEVLLAAGCACAAAIVAAVVEPGVVRLGLGAVFGGCLGWALQAARATKALTRELNELEGES